MEENKPTIKIHKSKEAKKLMLAIIGVIIFFSFVLSNPNEGDFLYGIIKKVARKRSSYEVKDWDKYWTDLDDISNDLKISTIERKNFILFSTFKSSFGEIEFSGFGVWNQVVIPYFPVKYFNSLRKEKPYLRIQGWDDVPQDAKEFLIIEIGKPRILFEVNNIQNFKVNDKKDNVVFTIKLSSGNEFIESITKHPSGWQFDS